MERKHGIFADDMIVIRALQYANEMHRGQERKGSKLPYATHPTIVGALVRKYKISKRINELVAAAILHDVIEDTKATYADVARIFGKFVADLVLELSSDLELIDKMGKNPYLIDKMTNHMSSYGLVLKLSDRLSNIIDGPTPKYIEDTKVMMSEILAKRKVLSETHIAIIEEVVYSCSDEAQNQFKNQEF